jgi:hypothetical protein
MRSVENKFTEAMTAAKKAGIDITPFIGSGSIEQRLNNLTEAMTAKGVKITESRPRVQRKNGAAIRESGIGSDLTKDEQRVAEFMQKSGSDYRESCLMCGLSDPGANAKEPVKFIEARKERLKKFYGSIISEQEITSMAERRIEP